MIILHVDSIDHFIGTPTAIYIIRKQTQGVEMKYVKLTDQYGETFNHTKWGPGVVHRTSGQGGLCGEGWLHCYGSDTESRAELLAVLLNPLHCNFRAPRGWRVECRGEIKSDNGLKFGTTEMECLEEIILPIVTDTQRVAFAILCAMKVYKDPKFQTWASEWLFGTDRSEEAAWSARATAMATAVRAESAAWSAWSAARSAMWAAWAAESAARTAEAAEAAARAAEAAWGTVEAAESTTWSARAGDLDLGLIAEEAMAY
jgi:hypothetical protein